MKTLLGIVILLMAAIALPKETRNTPASVAKNATECIKNMNFDGFVNLQHIDARSEKELEGKKLAISSAVKDFYNGWTRVKGGLKSFDITNVDMASDGRTASVDMHIVYGNGEVNGCKTVKMCRDNDGRWKMIPRK